MFEMTDVRNSKTDVSNVIEIHQVLRIARDFYENEDRVVTFAKEAEDEMFDLINAMNAKISEDEQKFHSSFCMGTNSKHHTKMIRYAKIFCIVFHKLHILN